MCKRQPLPHGSLQRSGGGALDYALLAERAAERVAGAETAEERLRWSMIRHVALRQFNEGWLPLLEQFLPEERQVHAGFVPLEDIWRPGRIPPRIVQIRPDKPPFSAAERQRASWARLNRSCIAEFLDGAAAHAYLAETFGPVLAAAYSRTGYPAGQADLTALAKLYCEGGVFADVYSVCRAPIASLIAPDSRLTFFAGPSGVEKFLIASEARHPFIGRFLDRAVAYAEHGLQGVSPEPSPDVRALTPTLLDCYFQTPVYLNGNDFSLIPRCCLDCHVTFTGHA